MAKECSIVHHTDRRTDVMMPYAPGIVVRRGQLVFLSGVTAAAVYHSHPHREEEFDLPATMREQAVLVMENLKKTLEAAGCTFADLVAATRFLTSRSRTISIASGPRISAVTFRRRRRSRCRVWPRTHGASSRSARSPSPTRRADGDRRLRRARHDGQPHGEAAARLRPAVVGYNRTREARALVAAGLTLAKSPRAVAEASDAVFSMVTDSAALRAIGLGPEA